jgi:phosphate-selective porin OprO/OprP
VPPPPAAEAPLAPDEAPPPPAAGVAVPAPADQARLEDIEQTARIAARKQELFEEEYAKRLREAPTVSVDDRGFVLKLPDGSYALKVGGLLQTDGRFFVDDDALQANDTFLIRRFRPSLDATFFSLVDARLIAEFAGTAVTTLDAYIDIHPWPWLRLRSGKVKPPVGLERLQSDQDLPLLERALTSDLSAQRDVGVQVWGEVAGGIGTYVVGIFNGAADGTVGDNDINHAKDFEGRLFFQPFKAGSLRSLGSLGFGVGASTGNRKGRLPSTTGLAPFKSGGQNNFFTYYAPANDTTGAMTTFAHERTSKVNPQLYYYFGPAGLLAEYVYERQGVQRGNSTATLTNQAAHVTVSAVIGGKEGYDGPTPYLPFDLKAGTFGAVELAVRYGWLKVDDDTFGTGPGTTAYADPTKSAKSAKAIAGNVNLVPRRSFHLGLFFEQTRFTGGAGTATAITDRKTENVFVGRAQIFF